MYLELRFSHLNDLTFSQAADDLLLPERNHHIAYSFELDCRKNKFLEVDVIYYDFRNADYANLNNFLASINLNSVLNSTNINSATDNFIAYCILELVISYQSGDLELVIF